MRHGLGPRFAALFAATMTAMLGVGVVITVLPRFVKGPAGGTDVDVGIVVGVFAIAAIAARPIAGRLADVRGRRAIVMTGAVLMALAAPLYAAGLGVPGLVAARVCLGFGEALVYTGAAIWAVDLAPSDRRGQAIGLLGLAVWGSMSVGAPIGEALLQIGSYDLVWLVAGTLPVLGAVLASRLPDPHVPRPRTAPAGALLPAGVVAPLGASALASVGFATVTSFLVLHLDALGDDRGPALFTVFAATVVVTRLAGGRLPDRLGARRSALLASAAEAIGLALIALASSATLALAGVVLLGLGFSTLLPALTLVAIDRTRESGHASALGAFTAGFDIGTGLGAPLVAAVVSLAGYAEGFWAGAACAAAAFGLIALLGPERIDSRPCPTAQQSSPEPPVASA